MDWTQNREGHPAIERQAADGSTPIISLSSEADGNAISWEEWMSIFDKQGVGLCLSRPNSRWRIESDVEDNTPLRSRSLKSRVISKLFQRNKLGPVRAERGNATGNSSAIGARTSITIGGRLLSLSNLKKVLYPKAGFTKGQVIDYYAHVARALLPHLKDRALTLKRYPNGVEGEFFYEKQCPVFRPRWVKTAPIWSSRQQEQISYCLANDLPSLIWAANLADLELHTSLACYKYPWPSNRHGVRSRSQRRRWHERLRGDGPMAAQNVLRRTGWTVSPRPADRKGCKFMCR